MANFTIKNYLQQNNSSLSLLLSKLERLKQWNYYLQESVGIDNPLLNHCQIVNLLENKLILMVDSPTWMTRMRFYVPELLAKLQQYDGLKHIKDIQCKVYPSAALKSKKNKQKPALLSAKTAHEVQETAKKVGDETIRKILEKIASRIKM